MTEANTPACGELHLPELEAMQQRHLRNQGRFIPTLPSPEGASTEGSTTAGSARSDAETRRIVFAPQEEQNPTTLKLRLGKNRLTLGEDDRSDFLNRIFKEDLG